MNQIENNFSAFFEKYGKGFEKGVLTDILGRVDDYMPVDTGNMRRNTFLEEDSQGPYLITKASYARSQYQDTLNHLIVNGRYASISRFLVDPGFEFKKKIKILKGSEKHSTSYWEKYHLLKEAGMFTKIKAEWFKRAFDDVTAENMVDASNNAVEKARSEISTKKFNLN